MYELNARLSRKHGDLAQKQWQDGGGYYDDAHFIVMTLPKVFKASLTSRTMHGKMAPQAIKSVTMSSISTLELKMQLLPALDNFGKAMVAYLSEDVFRAVDIRTAIKRAPSFQGGAQDLRSSLSIMKALALREITENGEPTQGSNALISAIDESLYALDRTVMAYALGTDYDQYYLSGFRAFSAWLPVSAQDYSNRIGDFSVSEFYGQSPNWGKWLSLVYSQAENRLTATGPSLGHHP